jgi:ribosomal protein S27AE
MTASGWPALNNIPNVLADWKAKLLNYKTSEVEALPVILGKPVCPNCSSKVKNIYLSPIPTDFVAIQNAKFECSACGYTE